MTVEPGKFVSVPTGLGISTSAHSKFDSTPGVPGFFPSIRNSSENVWNQLVAVEMIAPEKAEEIVVLVQNISSQPIQIVPGTCVARLVYQAYVGQKVQ